MNFIKFTNRPFSAISSKSIKISTEIDNFYENAMNHIAQTNKSPDLLETLKMIKAPKAILKFNMPIRRDNGIIEIVQGFKVHHSYHQTPCLGGFRFSPNVSQENMESLSILATIKNSWIDIPFAGSQAGIKINPRNYSLAEIERIVRRFTLELSKRNLLGAAVDVMGSDIGTWDREMAWIKDTHSYLYGNKDPNSTACVTGKPYHQLGIEGHDSAVAQGFYYALTSFIEEYSLQYGIKPELKGKNVIIQGYGKIGRSLHKILQDEGCNIIGIVENSSGVFCKWGLDFNEVNSHWIKRKTFLGYEKGNCFQRGEQNEILFKECDIFIPAATACTINSEIASKIKAKIIAEVANCAITADADKILGSNNEKLVLPDIIMNSGAAIFGYLEWIKGISNSNLGRLYSGWAKKSREDLLAILNLKNTPLGMPMSENNLVLTALEDAINSACQDTIIYSRKNKDISIRLAAYIISLQKITETYRDAGFTY